MTISEHFSEVPRLDVRLEISRWLAHYERPCVKDECPRCDEILDILQKNRKLLAYRSRS